MIISGPSEWMIPYMEKLFKCEVPVGTVLVGSIPELIVWQGQAKDFDKNIERIGPKIGSALASGGTNIMSPGSICVMFVEASHQDLRLKLLNTYQFIINRLKDFGIDLLLKGNDLVLESDGRKLSGFTYGELPNKTHFGGFTININVNNKLIQQSKKDRTGVGLKEFGITTEQMINILHEYWSEPWIEKTPNN